MPIVPVLTVKSMTSRPLVDLRNAGVVASQTRPDGPQPDLCRRPCSTSHQFVFRSCFLIIMVVLNHTQTIPSRSPFLPSDPARKLSGVVLKTRRVIVQLSLLIVKLAYQMQSDIHFGTSDTQFGTSDFVSGTSDISFGITYIVIDGTVCISLPFVSIMSNEL